MLNVVRRMNGFVELDSPANALQPYLQNDNGWDQGQIFFDSHSTWCQPPYYVQQMAATHHQPLLVESKCNNRNLNITARAAAVVTRWCCTSSTRRRPRCR